MAFEDRVLVCADCAEEFMFTAGEQEFYQEKGFQNEPKRCIDCRRKRRRSDGGQGGGGGSQRGQMYAAVCADCGQDCEVPFEPRTGRPIYCRDCFAKQRRQ